VYSNGAFTTLDVPGAAYTVPTSINNRGQVAGEYFDGSRTHGFVYSNGTFTTLDVPGATGTEAVSINASGQVAGSYRDGAGGVHSFIATPVCVAPTVAIHTLTTAPNDWFRITGSITLDGVPLCALVLANGQFMFTCGDPLPEGDFDLTVPPDAQGQITLFGFSSGLAPFQQTLGAGSLPASVNANICATPTVTHTVTTAPNGWFRITGSIALDGVPLCALVLANGQFMFTCGDPLPKGDFDLAVPPDAQGQITLFGFSSGLAPFQQTFSASSPTSTP
jgi:probable HAF family extracellular repeat protein